VPTRQRNKSDDMLNRFNRTPACDRRTDRQTSCYSIQWCSQEVDLGGVYILTSHSNFKTC